MGDTTILGRSTIVEFYGIPGAGKSTIAAAVASRLLAAGHAVDEPLHVVSPSLPFVLRAGRKLAHAGFEMLSHPLESIRLMVAISRSGQSTRDLIHRSQNWLVVRALVRRSRRRPGLHMFDQGFIQELGSIGLRGEWHTCLTVAGPGRADLAPDVVINVAATVEMCQERLRLRRGAQSRLESMTETEQEQALHQQARDLAEIERQWFGRFGTRRGSRHLSIDNSGPSIDGVVSRLISELVGSS